MSSRPPPAKKARFMIEDILPHLLSSSSSAIPPAENTVQYVQKLEGNTKINKKYQKLQMDSKFMITNLPPDPEALIAGIFQECVDAALIESRENGIVPDELGFTISSELLDPDVYLPFRPITANTVEMAMNFMAKVANSKRHDNISLYGEPFTVKITTINKKGLPANTTLTGGRPRKIAGVHHNVKKKAKIVIDNQNNNVCLFMALQATKVHRIGGLTDKQYYDYLNGRWRARGKLYDEAVELMNNLGIPTNLKGYDAKIYAPMVIDYWNQKYDGQFRFKLFIFGAMGHFTPLFKYGPDDYDTHIILHFEDKHFDGIRTTHGMFSKPYCLACETTYSKDEQSHKMTCKSKCAKCGGCGPKFPCKSDGVFSQKCNLCKKTFNNKECYLRHIHKKYCERSKLCEKCGCIWNVAANTRGDRKGHVCGERHCSKCGAYHDKERGCYIKPLKPKKDRPYRLVAFDVETTQFSPVDPANSENKKRKHEVNFVSAKIACPACIANGEWKESLANHPAYQCDVCGPNRTVTFGHCDFLETSVDFHHVSANPMADFVQWILYELPADYETICYAHNGGRFDFMFICKELYKEKLNPDLIRRGNKLYELVVASREDLNPTVRFRDSYNLLNMPLALLVPAFDLDVPDKGFFPYMANHPANYGVRMRGLPPKKDYLYEGFLPHNKQKFDEWYELHKDEEFYLDEALAAYGMNDCDILMAALVAFRQEFMEISKREGDENGIANRPLLIPHDGIDVLKECITIASACMKHFRTNHLPANHLALVPEKGFDSAETQSLVAFKTMDWYEKKHNVWIRNANSARGEKKIGPYKVDGWIEEENRAIEIHGCPFHGCPTCYPDDNLIMPCGKTAGWLRAKDKERMDYLKARVPVEVFWTCEIDKMLEEDKEMAKCFEEYLDRGPIDLRKGFYGGRTAPRKLYHKLRPGQKISYLDFNSLYPDTNFRTEYPIGIPKVLVINKNVNWTHPSQIPPGLSFLKVFVVPPRKNIIPVLPTKLNEKDARLLFPLCIKCAAEYPKGNVDADYSCQHSDNERGWVSLCTSIELTEALEQGYVVTELMRMLVFDRTDSNLFKPYVREFMSEKLHASGFDSSIKGDFEKEEQFIKECWDYFGIKVERSKMLSNKGKRALAKLCLNNLWGRFSLRNHGLSNSFITDDPAVLRRFMDDKSLEMMAVDELTEDGETIMISYMKKKDWVEEGDASNVIISLWTTSAARLKLLKAMQIVAMMPGCEILYTDTDSIIFLHPEDFDVFATCPHLGDLSSEIPDGYKIVEWVSGGAKQYGIKMQKIGADDEFDYILKIRGMTLSYDITEKQGLRYETFKAAVLHYIQTGEPQQINVIYPNFLKPSIKNSIVYSLPLHKHWKPFVGKGIVDSNTSIVRDFGFIHDI